MTMPFIKSLAELSAADLPLAGGKGANLGRLIGAGLPVPAGFCITTEAYRVFVATHALEPAILRLSQSLQADDPLSCEAISTQIRTLFETGAIPTELAAAISSAYAHLLDQQPEPPVAVRSSATAEDLPEMSFAGQQDTYLNIIGPEALLAAVRRCWGSLWTGRAMAYRARNGIDPQSVALAVVVQSMIPSQASGVLFTANPLTGRRTETVIDATLGLGEALVSGQVEPDHYTIDTARQIIIQKSLGAKAIAIHSQAGGGTVTTVQAAAEQQALPDDVILALARLGQQAEQAFGAPQDIEWAYADQRLSILQSRPITSLYPLPAPPKSDAPLEVYISFGAIQGMLDPITPLGRDIFAYLAAAQGRKLGRTITAETQHTFLEAGERLFLDFTNLLRQPIGRRILGVFISMVDPGSRKAFTMLLDDPRLAPIRRRPRFRTLFYLLKGLAAPIFRGVAYNLTWPKRGRERLNKKIDAALAEVATRRERLTSLAERVKFCEDTLNTLPPTILIPYLLPGVISGQLALQLLNRLAANLPDGKRTVLEMTRGLPHNVTTEMDLALWEVAETIHQDPEAANHFSHSAAETLAQEYLAGKLPPAAQIALKRFLQRYGLRGVGEIDLGRESWQDTPIQLMQVLGSYLQIQDTAQSPADVFRRGAAVAQTAQERLIAALYNQRGGWLKARLARWAAQRLRELGGLRESPKFLAIRAMGALREALQASGRELAAAGRLAAYDDLFFLRLSELKQLAADLDHQPENSHLWQERIDARRQRHDREMRRRRVPRLLLSDGTAFYEGVETPEGAGANIILGSPVSPGVVEGIVHVVLDPHSTQLSPGEILVCPATDPGWTPLFLAAGGLVMEVGGMMTHGSVVAREYGIPAVVGVTQATTILKTGQRIRLDGASGQISFLD
jgi:pyruvate,water dikinase